MSSSEKSMVGWALYLLTLGGTLMVAPNVILLAFGFPATNEPWIRIVGMLMLILAFYCWRAAVEHVERFIVWSVPARASVPLVFTTYVALGWAGWLLIAFGLVDLAGASWTALALKSERRPPTT